jgi:hypothetical protein
MKLFEPYRINNKLQLKNHIMMPPVVTRLATTTGHVTDALIDRYMLYAKGGAGIVVTEAVSVKKQKSGQLRAPDYPFFEDCPQRVSPESRGPIAGGGKGDTRIIRTGSLSCPRSKL